MTKSSTHRPSSINLECSLSTDGGLSSNLYISCLLNISHKECSFLSSSLFFSFFLVIVWSVYNICCRCSYMIRLYPKKRHMQPHVEHLAKHSPVMGEREQVRPGFVCGRPQALTGSCLFILNFLSMSNLPV